ncbi:ABC transporter permease [Kitasatospora sp. CB02891]|uniref:ABC transporter permease n=1 Tax=Kitasatospora sp. CB02891 TaxID=2020329 RepID=UPI000C2744A9|nr:ABC transporter permease [Kitasatospora sp. CB02891]PJN27760.1 multidrug ABC transporter permease [Kitasatospora sp. CB02891]
MSAMTMPVDAAASARRILLVYRHSPGLLASSLLVPVAMVGVFGYVFGSAMNVPGGGYREFLMPGLFALVALNAVMPAMVGGARDAGRGVTDRLRSMSVSRFGLLTGQALADLLVAAVVLVPTALVGLAAGWRIRHGLGPALGAFGLLLLFRFACGWVGTALGLAVGKEDTAGQLAVLTIPFSMLTSAFVPTGGMPGWLAAIAGWNPVSAVVEATRQLFGNPSAPGGAWPAQHPVAAALGWCALLLALAVPFAVRNFARAGR